MKKQMFGKINKLKKVWSNRTFLTPWKREHTVAGLLIGVIACAVGLAAVSGGESSVDPVKGRSTAQNAKNEAFCKHNWKHIVAQDQCSTCGVLSGPSWQSQYDEWEGYQEESMILHNLSALAMHSDPTTMNMKTIPVNQKDCPHSSISRTLGAQDWMNTSTCNRCGKIMDYPDSPQVPPKYCEHKFWISDSGDLDGPFTCAGCGRNYADFDDVIDCECVYLLRSQPAGKEPIKTLIHRCDMCLEKKIKYSIGKYFSGTIGGNDSVMIIEIDATVKQENLTK